MTSHAVVVPERGTVLAALELACRAPSLHNSQPWRWRLGEHTLHLHADPDRLLAATDPTGRELVMSCGAALHHARVALAASGWHAIVHRLPNPADREHLASIEFAPLPDLPAEMVPLARAIADRHTDRRPFLPEPVPRPVLDRLASLAAIEGASLTVADTVVARRELVVAMSAVNELQRRDAAYRTELAAWAARGLGAVDGVPASGLRSVHPPGRPLLGRDFSSAGEGDLVVPPVDDGAVLAVLSTESDQRLDWLRAGEAVSAVLLGATAAGLASCPLSQIAEAEAARDAVRSAVLGGSGAPQLLLRIGWAVTEVYPSRPSPRRPLAEVLDRLSAE
jgi:nitroreductase